MVVTGIPSFSDDATGRMQRMVHLFPVLQPQVPVPIITTDLALYHDVIEHLQA